MATIRARLAGGVAAAVLVTGAATGAVMTAALAAPSPSGADCVGLVVDPGVGKVTSGCPAFSAGLTGQQVLVAAGHKLTFDKNGFICQIDGYPSACGSDNTHYWAYYHRAPGAADAKWAFSEKGANDYVVHPGETEGWSYQNGTQRQPDAVPYTTLRAATPASPATNDHDVATVVHKDGSNWPLVAVVLVVVVLLAGTAVRVARSRRTR